MSDNPKLEAETAVAGSILIDPRCLPAVRKIIGPEHFTVDWCWTVFRAACELADAGETIDPVLIRNKAAEMGYPLEQNTLMQAMDLTPTAANAELYAKALKEGKQVETEADPLLSLFRPLEEFAEEEAKWLVPGWIPSGQISLMAADGGVGKTSLWCHIIAALSNGTTCILDPPGHTRVPMKITFMTTEDSVRKKLRKKLRLAGANMTNIITPDFVADKEGLLQKVKFGSPEMRKVLYHLRPILCVFDPVQGFLPPKVNMGSRNEMRDCMAPMLSIGEEINTTSMIICHTNKRKGASGRDRIADSADLWDIARSVMMLGFTEEQGVRYLSNEKNNYAQLQETILFTIDQDGRIHKEGSTWKRDREFVQDNDSARSAPKREDCKAYIIQALNEAGGAMPTNDLDAKAKQAGFSFTSIKRAKQDLKKENAVQYFQTGTNKDRVWHIQLLNVDPDLRELPDDTPVPFEETSRQTL